MSKSKPKITLYIPDLRGGGAERVIVNLANGFSCQGIETDIVLNRAEGPYLTDIDDSVNLVNLRAPKYPLYNAMGATHPLKKYLQDHNPDILLSFLARSNIVAILAARISKIDCKVIISQRNHLSKISSQSRDQSLRVLPPLVRCFYPLADGVIAISDGVKKDLLKYWPIKEKNVHRIYNPTITDELIKNSKTMPDHPWLPSGREFSVILAAGRLTEQKDYPTLIKALKNLSCYKNIRLVVLGEGKKKSDLIELTEELDVNHIVDFHGFVNNPFAFMSKSDVFVLSSAWEGFGNVLVEAMGCGTPVVSTDCESGPSEILNNGEYGPLVPVRDSAALANAIDETLADPTDQEKLIQRSKDFHADKIVHEYLDYLLPGGYSE